MISATPFVSVPLQEPLLVIKLQRYGKDYEELLYDLLVNVPREALDGLPVTLDYIRMRPLRVLWDELGDIIDLEVVLDARDEIAGTCWLPTVIVASFKSRTVWIFGGIRKREDRLRKRELTVNVFLCETVIRNVEEAYRIHQSP